MVKKNEQENTQSFIQNLSGIAVKASVPLGVAKLLTMTNDADAQVSQRPVPIKDTAIHRKVSDQYVDTTVNNANLFSTSTPSGLAHMEDPNMPGLSGENQYLSYRNDPKYNMMVVSKDPEMAKADFKYAGFTKEGSFFRGRGQNYILHKVNGVLKYGKYQDAKGNNLPLPDNREYNVGQVYNPETTTITHSQANPFGIQPETNTNVDADASMAASIKGSNGVYTLTLEKDGSTHKVSRPVPAGQDTLYASVVYKNLQNNEGPWLELPKDKTGPVKLYTFDNTKTVSVDSISYAEAAQIYNLNFGVKK